MTAACCAPGARGGWWVAGSRHEIGSQRLKPQPPGQRRDQHHAGVRHNPLVVERDLHTVQSDGRVIVHHEGDLLTAGPAAPHSRKLPAHEVILRYSPDGTGLSARWIRAKTASA